MLNYFKFKLDLNILLNSCQYLVNRWDLEEYFDDYIEEGSGMDDDQDDEAYGIEDCEFQVEPVELDTVEVDIDYNFCPDLMDWLLSHTDDSTTTSNSTWAKRLVEAGKSGNLEYIMWMRVKAAEMDQIVVSVFDFVTEVARNGHRHVLEWLQTEYGTNFATTIPAYIALELPEICVHASALGHLDILQWAFSNGLRIDLETCIHMALSADKLDVLILLKREYEHLFPNIWGCSRFDFSLESLDSSCDIFQWVHSNGCPWSARTYKALESHARTYKLLDSHDFEDRKEWAFQNGCQGPQC